MTHKTTKTARYFIAVGAAAALLSIAGGSVFAGEITGNGTLKEVQGRSSCAYSGQEDLQFFYDDGTPCARRRPPRVIRATRSRGARSTRPRAPS